MTPPFLLDHVVIRVDDLDAAIRDYTALGFTVVPGGEHPGLGSHNALIAFADDSYLELIAFRVSGPRRIVPKHVRVRELAASVHSGMERHSLAWETSPEGLIDFALRPSSAAEAIRDAKARGLSLEGPIPGSRLRPDGRRVAWQLGLADSFDLPFLCADVSPRSLRVPDGEARQHRNGAVGTKDLAVAVNDLPASVARYRALLGDICQEKIAGSVPGAETASLVLGPSTVTLAQPMGPKCRLLRDRLAERGEGPYRLTLSTAGGAPATKLDPSATHAANIDMVPSSFRV